MATLIATQNRLMILFLQKDSTTTPLVAAVNPTVGRVTLLEHMPNSRNVHFCSLQRQLLYSIEGDPASLDLAKMRKKITSNVTNQCMGKVYHQGAWP